MIDLLQDPFSQPLVAKVPGQGIEAVWVLDEVAADELTGSALPLPDPVLPSQRRGVALGRIGEFSSTGIHLNPGLLDELPKCLNALVRGLLVPHARQVDKRVPNSQYVPGEAVVSHAAQIPFERFQI